MVISGMTFPKGSFYEFGVLSLGVLVIILFVACIRVPDFLRTFHIPSIAAVSYTSTGPQHELGTCLDPPQCASIKGLIVPIGTLGVFKGSWEVLVLRS